MGPATPEMGSAMAPPVILGSQIPKMSCNNIPNQKAGMATSSDVTKRDQDIPERIPLDRRNDAGANTYDCSMTIATSASCTV